MSTLPLKDVKLRIRPSNGKIFFKVTDLEQTPEWPNGPLLELLKGELFMVPSSTTEHQLILSDIHYFIKDYLIKNPLGIVLTVPIDVELSDETLTIPDIVYISNKNQEILQEKRLVGSPDFIIEIVSTNKKQDYVDKKYIYEKHGIKEYWIVDPNEIVVLKYIYNPITSLFNEPIEYRLTDNIKVRSIAGLSIKIKD